MKKNKTKTQHDMCWTSLFVNKHRAHGTQNVKTLHRTTQKTIKKSNTNPTKKPGVNSGAREGQVVADSYKTPSVLLKYTVKSVKGVGSDRVKKHLRKK